MSRQPIGAEVVVGPAVVAGGAVEEGADEDGVAVVVAAGRVVDGSDGDVVGDGRLVVMGPVVVGPAVVTGTTTVEGGTVADADVVVASFASDVRAVTPESLPQLVTVAIAAASIAIARAPRRLRSVPLVPMVVLIVHPRPGSFVWPPGEHIMTELPG